MGALASGGVRVVNERVLSQLRDPVAVLERVAALEQEELERRERLYRADRPPPQIEGKTVLIVDDGLATGSTMRAAAAAVRQQEPEEVVVAVPTAPRQRLDLLLPVADEVVTAHTPEPFTAVGESYLDFSQTSDEEVRRLVLSPEPG